MWQKSAAILRRASGAHHGSAPRTKQALKPFKSLGVFSNLVKGKVAGSPRDSVDITPKRLDFDGKSTRFYQGKHLHPA